jgi:AmmeMemoRadiSam system protein A
MREFKMKQKKELHPVVKLAKDTVEQYIKHGKITRPQNLTDEMKEQAGVFVSIKKHGNLRGCIGTFEPTQDNIAEEIMHNAISSATQDPRFPGIRESELDELEYSVDILTPPKPVADKSKLNVKKHGVIVQCGWRRGLLLPDLEGVDTLEQQVDICRMKAGIAPDEPVELFSFEVRRYK